MSLFESYTSWADVLGDADHGRALFYHAPLDSAPRPVLVRRIYKNGKLRLDAGEVCFTADAGHLDRFRKRA